MARGVVTGKGDAWLPNWAAEKYKNIKNASTSNWWKTKPTGAAKLGMRGMGVAGLLASELDFNNPYVEIIEVKKNK